jgi:hypothetical protein
MPGKPIIFAAACRPKYYRLMFLAAALWNALAAVAVLFLINKGNLRTALEAISQELRAACLATFGLGYYWVSRDLSKNHDLVRLGAMGKLLVFVVFFGHLILGNITLRLVLPSLVDLLFGILFLELLACFKSNHSNLRKERQCIQTTR